MHLLFKELGYLPSIHLIRIVCLSSNLTFHIVESSLSQWLFLLHVLITSWTVGTLYIAHLSGLWWHSTLDRTLPHLLHLHLVRITHPILGRASSRHLKVRPWVVTRGILGHHPHLLLRHTLQGLPFVHLTLIWVSIHVLARIHPSVHLHLHCIGIIPRLLVLTARVLTRHL